MGDLRRDLWLEAMMVTGWKCVLTWVLGLGFALLLGCSGDDEAKATGSDGSGGDPLTGPSRLSMMGAAGDQQAQSTGGIPTQAPEVPSPIGGASDSLMGGESEGGGHMAMPSPVSGGTDLAAGSDEVAGAESGAGGEAAEVEVAQGCTVDAQLAEGERIVLVGHRFTEEPQVQGTEIRSLSLTEAGVLTDLGVRLEVGFTPQRIAVLPAGDMALVMGEQGDLVSVALDCTELRILDRLDLEGAGFADLTLQADGVLAFLVNKDTTDEGGIYTVEVGADGGLESKGAHFPILLARAIALYPGSPTRALLVGGQTMFDPLDDQDVRTLAFDGDRWRQTNAFDIYTDFIQCEGIAVSGDGLHAFITNSSPFSAELGHLVHLDLSGDGVQESQRFVGQGDISHARALPDGETFVVSVGEADQVKVFAPHEGTGAYALTQTIDGIGLAQQMAIAKGADGRTWVLLSAINTAEGPNVTIMESTDIGHLEAPVRVPLGLGAGNIPSAIGIRP